MAVAMTLLIASCALGQPLQSFEVATIKPSVPLSADQAVRANAVGGLGAHMDGMRARYTYMTLKSLIVYAYNLEPYQVTAPDWMASERFDIVALLPEGTTRDDVPLMLKALLADRFKLRTHFEDREQSVYALVVSKDGPKLKESPEQPPIDENVDLKPNEMKLEYPDGPARISRAANAPPNLQGATELNMGIRGVLVYGIEPQAQVVHIEGVGVAMSGLADMLTQVMRMGGPGARPVVDQTGLEGHYQIVLDLSLADLMGAAGTATSEQNPTPGVEATDPGEGGGTSVFRSIEKLGLKLQPSKASLQQLIVDSAEKNPVEN
jgi:uncharacterized protein (TIGR03435 family)